MTDEDRIADLEADLIKANKQIAEFRKYAQHLPKCRIMLEIGCEDDCTCGFKALKE